jgi:hypothetical protein
LGQPSDRFFEGKGLDRANHFFRLKGFIEGVESPSLCGEQKTTTRRVKRNGDTHCPRCWEVAVVP